MANEIFLDLSLKLLVLEYGRTRVLQGFSRIEDVTVACLEEELIAVSKTKQAKSARVNPTPDQVLNKLQLQGEKKERVATLAREFVNKRFLGELRLVGKFFRDHQVGTVPKTRIRALPKVVAVLATLHESELDNLIADCSGQNSHSEYSHLAGAIMGQK